MLVSRFVFSFFLVSLIPRFWVNSLYTFKHSSISEYDPLTEVSHRRTARISTFTLDCGSTRASSTLSYRDCVIFLSKLTVREAFYHVPRIQPYLAHVIRLLLSYVLSYPHEGRNQVRLYRAQKVNIFFFGQNPANSTSDVGGSSRIRTRPDE